MTTAPQNNTPLARTLVQELRARLAYGHDRIKHCVNQLSDAQVWWRPDDAMNSVGNILLHLAGNVRQWMILPVTGEPDERKRYEEFTERTQIPKADLLRRLDQTVTVADKLMATLTDALLVAPRRVQGFDETILSSILNSLVHFGGHVQEIIYITRLQLRDQYRFAWNPETPEQGAAPK